METMEQAQAYELHSRVYSFCVWCNFAAASVGIILYLSLLVLCTSLWHLKGWKRETYKRVVWT